MTVHAELWLSELLFNPPGPDSPNEYIELRGTPNSLVPAGTYLVSVAGDAGANPGTVQNVFDLSGDILGGNGFLVLLQKDTPYLPSSGASVLVNTNGGSGWGSGGSSSLGHRGRNGITDLENASVTFFLVQSPTPPAPGTDLDANDDGILDGSLVANWTVLDSVGVLDGDGAGDFAYGALNFRLNSAPGNTAQASGVIVPVGFVPRYVARLGNTSGSTAAEWCAADGLLGSPGAWVLGNASNTYPSTLSGVALNHIGAPNFGAPEVPGVVLTQSGGATEMTEDGATDTFILKLNTPPSGIVSVQVACGPQLQVSLNQGSNYAASAVVQLSNQTPVLVTLRALDDGQIDASPHFGWVTNSVITSTDPAHYPLSSLIPPVKVAVTEKNPLLLTELKVNPPGTNDAPCEFIEIAGPPLTVLTNICFMAIEGDSGNNPGRVDYLANLSGVRIGTNGLLMLTASNSPYAIPPAATRVADSRLDQPGGALGNGTISFLLVQTTNPPAIGDDLDKGDNGILEGLPSDTVLLDAVGWSKAGNGDIVYGGVTLLLNNGTPDAATRFPGDTHALSAAAWFCGQLTGAAESLAYDPARVSANFPADSTLTPGTLNNTAPWFGTVVPVSGVVGDAFNPPIRFVVGDRESGAAPLVVWATGSNAAVVPNANLSISASASGSGTLHLNPVGVGYSEITLWASDGSMTGKVSCLYAASAPGRPGTAWHQGASDGSTAIPIDAETMVVGDDENQTLRIFSRFQSGLPLAEFDFTPFLGLPDSSSGLPREVDVEASTRVGNRLFWMGSLGHAASGESRTNRTRVFATDLAGSGANATLTYAGRYDFLKLDLLNWDAWNLHGKGTNYYGLQASDADGVPPKAPDGSGLAIEGLAMMPGNTNGAYVAFRAPIVPASDRTFALIVPILNFATVSCSGGPPGSCIFGAPIELDLYGRGIRSIEGSTNGYLLVGGPAGASTGPYPQDFRLYSWTGNPLDQPQQRTAVLSDLNPEGIIDVPPAPWTATTQIEILSDNGSTVFYGDGIPAKRLAIPNFKKCRSDVLPMGAVTKPAPFFTSVTPDSRGLTLCWRSLKTERYRLQAATQLSPANWSELPGDIVATGPRTSVHVDTGSSPRFFRVFVVP